MRYLVLLVLTVGLVACDPSDVVDVEINPGQAVQDAVDGVQQGVNGFNDAVQNFGGEGESEGEGEESENEE